MRPITCRWVDHRRRHQVVALEGLGGVVGLVLGVKLITGSERITSATVFPGSLISSVSGQDALRWSSRIDHEQLVGVVGSSSKRRR